MVMAQSSQIEQCSRFLGGRGMYDAARSTRSGHASARVLK